MRKSSSSKKQGAAVPKAVGDGQPAGRNLRKALGSAAQKMSGGGVKYAAGGSRPIVQRIQKALDGVKKAVGGIRRAVGKTGKTADGQKEGGGSKAGDGSMIGRSHLVLARGSKAKAPILRGKASRSCGPSIHDMPLHLKHQVLDWTIQGQSIKQREAQKRADDAEAIARVKKTEYKDMTDLVMGSALHQCPFGPKMVRPDWCDLVQRKIEAQKRAPESAKDAVLAKQVFGQIGADIEHVGMINKNMRDRMLKGARPVLNPTAIRSKDARIT